MEEYWWVFALGAVGLFLYFRMPRPGKFALATNAVLTELKLETFSLRPDSPTPFDTRAALLRAWQHSVPWNVTMEHVRERFNDLNRIEQLNLIAMAFNELGEQPGLPGEFWHNVKNPFLPVDQKYIDAVAERIRRKHGPEVRIRSRPLLMTDDRICERG